MSVVPPDVVQAMIGRLLIEQEAEVAVEPGLIQHWCEAMEDGNPLYHDAAQAGAMAGGLVAPPAMLPAWLYPLRWKPGGASLLRPTELHFRLKDALNLPQGIATGNEIEFHQPVRPGDRLRAVQRIAAVGEEETNRLGTGRRWTIEIEYTNQRGELVGREIFRLFGYRRPPTGGSA